MVHGPPGSGKTFLAGQACEAIGKPLLEWDLRDAPAEEGPFLEAVDRLLLEAKLRAAVPAFDRINVLERPASEGSSGDRRSEDRRLERLLERLDAWRGLLFLFAEEETKVKLPPSSSMVVVPLALDMPDIGERRRLWADMAEGTLRLPPEDAEALAGRFLLTPGQIEAVIEEMRKTADWRRTADGTGQTVDPGQADKRDQAGASHPGGAASEPQLLYQTAYRLIQHRLREKATKLEPKFGWDDLVLPPDTVQLLRRACDRVHYRHTVLHEWGFESKLPYGKGTSMLFTGPPGTGKTMSAMVMAREMNAELYRVDLSRVVSKYVGETEKNLSEIFDQARLSGAILFFDEADALFGKRSEVKDAHDKYANMETSYLLQKMEEYDGLTILASNFSQNLDDAFTRRIPFIVKYPFPDAVQREQLWRSVFPKKLPVQGDIDFPFLAQAFELSGGPIKNVVVTAAFLAASEGVPVSMKQIIEGVVQEYKKTGKVLLRDRLGAYANYWKG
ncbi:ATP-binding protein [Cohnella fermenti]|uniref:ATP-binding protein n=2 Tax=Cohnella fermenti TaxID=2565925 RepID=A0A4S4BPX0_9BACL|nr:ATP-binding protein [Cohnella fermenti]